MTYNVAALRGDRSAAVAVVRAADPDVLCLTEPPLSLPGPAPLLGRWPRWGPLARWRLDRFAREAGLRVAVAGPDAASTAVLVRPALGVAGGVAVRLPARRSLRGAAAARVGGLGVVCVHLSLRRPERVAHLERLAGVVEALGPAVVVAGDLNEPPGFPAWRWLAERFVDAGPDGVPTYPAADPRYRIDAVHVTGVEVVAARVAHDELARRGSDHLPVVVDLRA